MLQGYFKVFLLLHIVTLMRCLYGSPSQKVDIHAQIKGRTIMISNDAVIMGMLAVILGGIFITESSQNSALKNSIRSFLVFCFATLFRHY